ncbi:HAD hydrolase-like protein [Desulfotruncus arcticus]|uniref:HAD hydrolase-like protein n=1 Tax=Desulfotruncus arcticus TaxID=341036 RepID=UPI0023674977|nr:HAD hydrolase-like protein [Desulfotruncus arcticus]
MFDFDGTIVDSRYLAIEAINKLAKKYNFQSIKEEELEDLRTLSLIGRCKKINLPIFKIPFILFELNQLYGKSIISLRIYEGLKTVLGELKKAGLKISIVSSNSIENINEFLKNSEINVFDNVYSSGSFFNKDRAIAHLMRKYNLNSREVIYIGDEIRDIIACKKSSVRIIAVSWGYDSKELLEKANPDYLVDSPAQIIELIKAKI